MLQNNCAQREVFRFQILHLEKRESIKETACNISRFGLAGGGFRRYNRKKIGQPRARENVEDLFAMEKLRILFTGDSITDVNRTDMVRMTEEWMSRDPNATPQQREEAVDRALGCGYPLLVASQLGAQEPGRYEFLNRGISGNRVVDLDARIKRDCINLRPDVISILIGVNDVWHELGEHNGVDAPKFRRVYEGMLQEITHALPGVKLILLEPYVLQGPATLENWDTFRREVDLRREVVRDLAKSYWAHASQGNEMSSSVARMAVNICRIATIVGLLRGNLTPDAELPADNLKDGIVTRWDIHLSPADFKAVIGLVEPLYLHATHILSFLPQTEISRRTNADRDSFFNGMPQTFSRTELLEHAAATGINANTAQSWLYRLLKHGAVQETASKGHYHKT